MKYYVDQIEQVQSEGSYTEYGSRTQKADYNAALVMFYDRLKNVSNSSAHTFFDIKIVNSTGGIVKRDSIGTYVEA